MRDSTARAARPGIKQRPTPLVRPHVSRTSRRPVRRVFFETCARHTRTRAMMRCRSVLERSVARQRSGDHAGGTSSSEANVDFPIRAHCLSERSASSPHTSAAARSGRVISRPRARMAGRRARSRRPRPCRAATKIGRRSDAEWCSSDCGIVNCRWWFRAAKPRAGEFIVENSLYGRGDCARATVPGRSKGRADERGGVFRPKGRADESEPLLQTDADN